MQRFLSDRIDVKLAGRVLMQLQESNIMTLSFLKTGSLATLLSAIVVSLVSAQSITVGIEEFADLGISGARMNLMTTDPSGRLFVNDQDGGIYLIDRATRNVTEYVNLSNDVLYPSLDLISAGEPGFQSFAFHPDFATVGTGGFGKFYTIHSSLNTDPTPDFDPGGGTSFHSVLLEWNTSDPSAESFVAADPANPFREVIRFDQPFSNHNTGQLAFNPSVNAGSDRTNLYIGVGDGGSGNDPQNNGQDAGNPYGAVLRIDPLGNNSANGQYGIVADNVFASDGSAATLAENYSIGLRNPQRFGWDQRNGNLYIADIGQNAFEEINLAQNGGNFGWDVREGLQGGNAPGAIDPVATYSHSGFLTNQTTGSRAITVGEVVMGSGISALEGQLLLGDFPNGVIWTLDVDSDPLDGGQSQLDELLLIDVASGSKDPVRLLDLIDTTSSRADLRFSFDAGGDVFILNKRDGIVRRLVSLEPEFLLGDVNRDGMVNFLDITPFISLLSGGGNQIEADINGDGAVNFLDIVPFIALLSS